MADVYRISIRMLIFINEILNGKQHKCDSIVVDISYVGGRLAKTAGGAEVQSGKLAQKWNIGEKNKVKDAINQSMMI